MNWRANSEGLFDLKTATLSVILEQLGLGQSMRYVFALRQWTPEFDSYPYFDETSTWLFPNYVVRRNFDPESLLADSYVNGVLFGGHFYSITSPPTHFVFSEPIDVQADPIERPVADFISTINDAGVYATNLTRDDVGGLRFLLHSTNVVYEELPSTVSGSGTNANGFVNGAWRGGVERLTFLRHPYNSLSGTFGRFTNLFVDTYFTHGIWREQQLQRVTAEPGFLFCADNHGREDFYVRTIVARTGTTNWANYAQQNGRPGAAGPGVICPQIRILFQKLGPFTVTYETGSEPVVRSWTEGWGSFDASTNLPVAYPEAQSAELLQTSANFGLRDSPRMAAVAKYTWSLELSQNQTAVLQTSTNLLNWTTCATITNRGTVASWVHYGLRVQQRFFRVIGGSDP